ncbi:MAG: hypothetical protein ACQGVC_06390 [Myxococcota bacterium]
MQLLRPGPEVAPHAFHALAMVARAADAGLDRPQRALLDAIQQVVLRTDLDVDAARPITPQELGIAVDDPAQARQWVRLMVALALVDGPPSREQMSRIRAFAEALRVEEPAVKVVSHLAKGHLLRFRLAFLRHSHIRTYLRNTRRMLGGVPAMIRGGLVARGALAEDAENVARYRALGDLPEGTLGRAFYEHYTGEGLAFPGEKGGFPVGALFHDFSHVLAGYDTSPEGEMKNAAFQSGFTRDDDDFFTMLFAIVIHTAGVNLAPFPMPVLRGRIGRGRLALEVMQALERGAALKTDLGDGWDFWDYVALPLEEARQRLGVPPLSASG